MPVSTTEAEAAWLLQDVCAPLGLSLDMAQLSKLSQYLDLLSSWNKAYNLTAVRDRADMRVQHLADCLAVVNPLSKASRSNAQTHEQLDAKRHVLDVGSGGGLPGVVLAIALPDCHIHCVDAVAKKAAFVQQVAGSLSLPNLFSVHGRVEQVELPLCDLVVSRAFASLQLFSALTAKHLLPGGVWAAMKAKVPEDEIQALPANTEVFHVEQLAVPGMDAERCIVWMRPVLT